MVLEHVTIQSETMREQDKSQKVITAEQLRRSEMEQRRKCKFREQSRVLSPNGGGGWTPLSGSVSCPPLP